MRIVLNPRCLLAALVAALVFNGCGRSGGPGEQARPLKLAVVTNNSSDWWTIARKGGEKAASELPGVSLDFRMLAEGTAAAQKALVDDLLARGVDGIAVSPLDVENQRQMLDEAASKSLLFTLGADAPASRRVCYAGTDDVASGRMAGELVRQTLPQGGKIMVFVGRRDAQNAIDRFNGLKQGLESSGVEIVDVRTDDADATKAKTNVADTLVRYPNIDGLVGLWSYNGPAILSAVTDAGKLGKVRIVTFDGDPNTFWLASGPEGPEHPHALTISFPAPVTMSGLVLMPRQNHREHEGDIREYVVSLSDDGSTWRELTRGELASTFEPQRVNFPRTVAARHLKFMALSGFGPDPTAALAEVAVVYAGPKLKETGEDTPEYRRGRTATTEIDEGGGIVRPTKASPKSKPKPRPRGRRQP